MEVVTSEFTPERLAFARSRAGLTRLELSRAADVSPQSVANYENGATYPNRETWERLATALGVPSAFLSGAPLPELEPEAPHFRALSKMSKRERSAALTTGSLAIVLNEWLEERLRLPESDVPIFERGALEPNLSAQRLREKWEMGYVKVRNVVHLLESHGVRVFSLPENLASVDAFSFWRNGVPYVVLNTRKAPERGRFDAAHELGHLVLHTSHDVASRQRELEANRFAAAFLMPEEDVLASGLRNAGVEAIISAKARWGVSAMALTHRLHELGMTSDWTYTTTCRRLSQMGYRRGEPDSDLAGRENSQLLSKAFAAMRERNVGQADIAADLRIPADAVQELVFGLVMQPVQGQGSKGRSDAVLRVVGGS